MPTVIIGGNTGNTFTGVEDVLLRQDDPDYNHSTDDTFQASKYDSASWANSLIKFTGLSNIAGPVVVSDARLRLYQNDGGPSTYTVNVRRMLVNWIVSQCTWNIYSTGNNWPGSAGALTNGTDRDSALSSSLSLPTTAQFYEFLGLAQNVQDIINGVNPNYGWHLERADAGNDNAYKYFISTDAADDGHRPELSVTYTVAPPSGPSAITRFDLNIYS